MNEEHIRLDPVDHVQLSHGADDAMRQAFAEFAAEHGSWGHTQLSVEPDEFDPDTVVDFIHPRLRGVR